MARPKKIGLDYIPLDVDILKKHEVRKLMRCKGGSRALGVLVGLLCRISQQGYYLDYNEDLVFDLSSSLFEDENFVEEVIDICQNLGIFDRGLFEKYRILTSADIQKRYMESQTLHKRISFIDMYNLLNGKESNENVSSEEIEVSSEETLVNSEEIRVSSEDSQIQSSEEMEVSGEEMAVTSEEMGVSSEETIVNSEETPITSEETQSFEKKKKKRKEPKENKNKKSPSSSSPTPARERRAGKKDFDVGDDATQPNGDQSLMSEVKGLQDDAKWQTDISEMFGIKAITVPNYLEQFANSCKCRGTTQHLDLKDLKSHFVDWLRIQFEETDARQTKIANNGKQRKHTVPSNDRRRAASVPIGARQEDFGGEF